MEEKNFSSESENEIEKEMIKIKDLEKLLREKISKCINEERKKSNKLDKRLFELEIDMMEDLVKDKRSKPGRPSNSISRLDDWIRDYSSIKDIDKKIRDLKKIYSLNYEKELERDFVSPY